ncbi:MAG TPA: methyltransferase domain-containing protein [Pseudonocardiaceae bacterium]|nr:methyltransferase domain-containing protein [Pseudonocardiaceae bacterium]
MTTDITALADALRTKAQLPADWDKAFRSVLREWFIPDRIWVDEHDDGHDVALDRATEPERWRTAVYSNRVIVTQFDDGDTVWPNAGYRPTSSCSMPSAVLGMLDVLDVRAGMRVLEIGTGTGYNAALLAARLGDENLATVEVDPVLADQARSALIAADCTSTVVCADGAAGWCAGAPFDRIIVTAAVKLGRVPYAWVEQTAPGGMILTPLKTDFTAGPLVAFTVGQDGTAIGRVAPLRVAFMELRAQRTSVFKWDGLRWDDPDADLTHTDVMPWTTLGNEAPQWAIAIAVPSCRYELWPRTCGRNPRHGVAWLADPLSGSWASVIPGLTKDRYEVRQRGPRRLWDEVEAAYRWWVDQGEPTLDQWRFTVSPDSQMVSLQ